LRCCTRLSAFLRGVFVSVSNNSSRFLLSSTSRHWSLWADHYVRRWPPPGPRRASTCAWRQVYAERDTTELNELASSCIEGQAAQQARAFTRVRFLAHRTSPQATLSEEAVQLRRMHQSRRDLARRTRNEFDVVRAWSAKHPGKRCQQETAYFEVLVPRAAQSRPTWQSTPVCVRASTVAVTISTAMCTFVARLVTSTSAVREV